jgi:hypothetical protein
MSRWELYTWVSIVVLVAGSIAVFAWFLRDALRLYRRLEKHPPPADPAVRSRDLGP